MVGPLDIPNLLEQLVNQIPAPVPPSASAAIAPKPRVRTTMTDEETISWFRSWASIPLPCEYCDTLYIPQTLATLVSSQLVLCLWLDNASDNPLRVSQLQGIYLSCLPETCLHECLYGFS
jgi:hypothetical protein